MSSKPWRPDVPGLPSDEELHQAVAQNATKRRAEVKRLVADPEVYADRLVTRGDRVVKRWVNMGSRKWPKWQEMEIANRRHTASAAVNEGSAKAIRTTLPARDERRLDSLPHKPTVGWLKVVDKRTAIDQGRKQTLANQREPSRGDTSDPDDLQAQEQIAARNEIGRTPVRQTGEGTDRV